MNGPVVRPLPARIVDTFAAPRRLFAGFRDHAPWFDVLLISTGAAAVTAANQPAEFYLRPMENPVNRRGKPVVVTSSPEQIVHYGRQLAMLSALVGHPIVAFSLAGLLTLLFSVLGGGRASFRQYLAVVSHALLVPAAGSLVLLAASAALGHPVSATADPLLPFLPADGLARAVLRHVDLFQLWMLGLLALGVDALDGRRRWPAAALLLLSLYLLFAVAMTFAR